MDKTWVQKLMCAPFIIACMVVMITVVKHYREDPSVRTDSSRYNTFLMFMMMWTILLGILCYSRNNTAAWLVFLGVAIIGGLWALIYWIAFQRND